MRGAIKSLYEIRLFRNAKKTVKVWVDFRKDFWDCYVSEKWLALGNIGWSQIFFSVKLHEEQLKCNQKLIRGWNV